MTTVTDDLAVARLTLEETDDFHSEEVNFRASEISVEASENGSYATMQVEGDAYRLSTPALKQLATELRIPADYLLRCSAALQAENLHAWQLQLSDRKRVRAVIHDTSIMGITSKNYLPARQAPLLDRLVESIGAGNPDNVRLDVFEHDWEHTRMGLTNTESQRGIQHNYLHSLPEGAQVGDNVRVGANLTNSMIGLDYLELEPLAFRLVCLNRMVTPLHGADRLRYKDGSPNDWLVEAIDAIGEQYEPMFERMDEAARTVLDDPERVIRDQLRNVPGPVREAVLNAYAEEPIPTVWGVANAFTRAGTHEPDLQRTHRLAAERHGGWYSTSQDVCTTCGRANGHGAH